MSVDLAAATATDGGHACPKCGEVVDSMDAWMGHVSDAHDVYAEFVARWGGVDG